MEVNRVLPVIPVRDIDTAVGWYSALMGRPADRRPMPSLADWRIGGVDWLQILEHPAHAGFTTINVAVEDIDATVELILTRGVEPSEVAVVSRGVRLASVHDPDGNCITIVEDPDERN